ncbi:MAG: hypothetical protein MHPSP_000393 [Paramarteilia canceri]
MIEKCPVCNTTVYPVEKIPFRSEAYHKSCFKCSDCKCALSIGMGNFCENKILCEKCVKAHSVKSMSKNNYKGY